MCEKLLDTVAYYNAFSADVRRRTECRDYSRAFSAFLSLVPDSGTILDIGCGSGSHMKYFESKGFSVIGVDPSCGMRGLALAEGMKVVDGHFRSLGVADRQPFDGAWCAASLLHVCRDECEASLDSVKNALRDGAPFFATVRRGEHSGWDRWDSPDGPLRRFIQEYMEWDLLSMLNNVGFATIECWIEESYWGRPAKWISVIGRKEMSGSSNQASDCDEA